MYQKVSMNILKGKMEHDFIMVNSRIRIGKTSHEMKIFQLNGKIPD